MKGHLHPKNDITINPSGNESILDVIGRVSMKRRRFITTTAAATAATVFSDIAISGFLQTVEAAPVPAGLGFGGIGFESIEPNLLNPATQLLEKDLVTVPKGYTARILSAWGDPIMPGAPNWLPNASQDASAQEKQVGMNHDGMHFFPLPGRSYLNRTSGLPVPVEGRAYNNRGLLCINHEYTQEYFLHPDGNGTETVMTIEKARKSQAAHGVSIQEISKGRFGNSWSVDRNSRYGRRITANTEMRVSGPAAGDALMKSKKFSIQPTGSVEIGTNDGYTAYGTINNCAHGITPWGTYLTCEENFQGYFANPNDDVVATPGLEDKTADIRNGQRRYGISSNGGRYRWPDVDPRWDAYNNPLETHLFGWIVEIDPYDPNSKPVKRTSMGRIRHESAQYVVDDNNRLAYYTGDDNVNEYIYKFVCSRQYNPNVRSANRDLLDHGTLYVAKFNDDGTGQWLPLVWGQGGLTPENGFANQAEVLIKTRQAADRLGATMMDRPEWIAERPRIGGFNEVEVYCTLTANNRRVEKGASNASVNNPDGLNQAGSARPPVDEANPRPDNIYGHIIRWRETGRSVAATTFNWDIFVLCGDKQDSNPNRQGNINGDDFVNPDGLWFDYYGRLWIQTDHSGTGRGTTINIGSNSIVCANPNDPREVKLFLSSPTDCEVTGIITTPDHRTMFINIQHPGSRGSVANPTSNSNWPHSQGYGLQGRPRSATVVITKDDGGIIGA